MKRLVGLTGKTGAGKSTVSKYLSEKGAYIIDGDIVAREVLRDDGTILRKLSEAFGDILNADGTLDRRALARVAFSTPGNTDKLNRIIHPAINTAIHTQADNAFSDGYKVVIVDAAAIIESGYADECDALYVVHAPEDIRLSRIMKRDNISEEDALVRIRGQKADDFYFSRADGIIRTYEPYSLNEQLLALEKELFD
jgi:dephospho-CoA kinase